jgi:hypothetical protein
MKFRQAVFDGAQIFDKARNSGSTETGSSKRLGECPIEVATPSFNQNHYSYSTAIAMVL